ncbi:MAG: VTT domain-containing protein, partial [Thermoproteota archaeon]
MVDLSGIASSIIELARGVSPALAPFFIAFFGNVIPYMTVPYLVAIAGYGAALPGFGSKAIAAVSAALGAGLGKVVVFSMGRSIHRVLPQGTRENLSVFASAFRRGVFIAVFIFAALPLPDDVLYVPLGVAGYSLLYFFVAVTLGKLVITSLAIL